MRNFIPVLIVCFLGIPGFAQEQDAPKSLVGFLKPGMNIGVLSFAKFDAITIGIYTEEDFSIAIDARKLSSEDLASKYEKVASAFERTRKDLIATSQTSKEKLPVGKEYGEPRISISTNRSEFFYKVVSIGDDYILVTDAMNLKSTNPKYRRVIATRYISSMHWHDELPLSISTPYVDTKTDKNKP